MPDKVIDIPGVGPTAFPDSMSDAEVNAASTRLYQGANPGKKQPPVKTWTDTAVNALPAVGSALGGITGGIGGTAFGIGFGGIPGAAAGAGLGGATGEAARQLINRARGADAPDTSALAAASIGKEGAIDAASTGVMGAIGSRAVPVAAGALADFGTNPNAPKVGATVGRLIGGVAPAIGGAMEGGVTGFLAGLAAASKGAWAGGQTGWFTTKMTQSMARPIAQALANATGVAPAAIAESLAGLPLGHALQALIGAGVPPSEATRTVMNAKIKAED